MGYSPVAFEGNVLRYRKLNEQTTPIIDLKFNALIA